jgi:hypothetical protein
MTYPRLMLGTRHRGRWNTYAHLRNGLAYRFPLCCVLEWCLRFWLNPRVPIAIHVGCTYRQGCAAGYVHCYYHRK